MKYLVFPTKELAEAANKEITKNMGLGADTTKAWAIPQMRFDKKWLFQKPDGRYLESVTDYSEAEYSEEWFQSQEFD